MECIFIPHDILSHSMSDYRPSHHAVIYSGTFLRKSDHQKIQRYYCKGCKKSFSTESLSPLKYQKKRHLNEIVFSLFASGNSQRRIAKLIQINRKTAVRKFIFLGKVCLKDIEDKKHLPQKIKNDLIFDDMETFEHTKLKPLSITMAVENKTRFILGFRVSSMKAKGLLSKKSVKKYGIRKDERHKNLHRLLLDLKQISKDPPCIKTDMNPHYIYPVKKNFPQSVHLTFKGRKPSSIGQGELKTGGFDPIFSFNHTAAMLRANINRLFRRTWNTTKKQECLNYHIAIYIFYHNLRLLK